MATKTLKIGDAAIDFDLPATDGSRYSLESFAGKKALIVIFSCNHCPYVVAYEDRMVAIQRDYEGRGVSLVAINANDDVNYPEDSFGEMKKRAKKKGFNFPYLRDADQSVARAYDAACTPEILLFDGDRKLRYHGRIDDNYQNPDAVRSTDLRDAIDAVLEGRAPKAAETRAIGCSIKWK